MAGLKDHSSVSSIVTDVWAVLMTLLVNRLMKFPSTQYILMILHFVLVYDISLTYPIFDKLRHIVPLMILLTKCRPSDRLILSTSLQNKTAQAHTRMKVASYMFCVQGYSKMKFTKVDPGRFLAKILYVASDLVLYETYMLNRSERNKRNSIYYICQQKSEMSKTRL